MPQLTVDINDDDKSKINRFLFLVGQRNNEPTTHGNLTIEKLAAMLLEDVSLAMSRPGSWEGSNMIQILISHGYDVF